MYTATQHLKKLALVVTMAGLSTGLQAASVSGTATARVVTPISISQNTPMNFGDVAVGTGGGTVVLLTDDSRSVTGDAEALSTTTGTAAIFDVTGFSGATYAISYTAGTLSDGGGNTMTVNAFTDDTAGSGTLILGSDQFVVGATLNINGGQATGTYSTGNAGGTAYTVTVNYN